jgi:hypothetical protein
MVDECPKERGPMNGIETRMGSGTCSSFQCALEELGRVKSVFKRALVLPAIDSCFLFSSSRSALCQRVDSDGNPRAVSLQCGRSQEKSEVSRLAKTPLGPNLGGVAARGCGWVRRPAGKQRGENKLTGTHWG